MKYNRGFSVTSLCYLKCAFELEYGCVIYDRIDSPGSVHCLGIYLRNAGWQQQQPEAPGQVENETAACQDGHDATWDWLAWRWQRQLSRSFHFLGSATETCVSSNLPLTSNPPNKSKSFPALWKSEKRLRILRVNSSVIITCDPMVEGQPWEHYSCQWCYSRWSRVGGPPWPSAHHCEPCREGRGRDTRHSPTMLLNMEVNGLMEGSPRAVSVSKVSLEHSMPMPWLQRQSWVLVTETIWSAKPKIFII